MILSSKRVEKLLEEKTISIFPSPTEWTGVTFDGHVGDKFYTVKSRGESGSRITIDLANYKPIDFAEEFWEPLYPTPEGYIPIHPMQLILCYSKERFKIPKNSGVCCFVEGKSGLARIGLGVHITAPIIHPGFGEKKDFGQEIMLEMFNHSQNIILLRPNVQVCQYMFMDVDGDTAGTKESNFANNQPKAG